MALRQGKTSRGNRTNATVNRYLAVLSHLFTISVKEWGWSHENPVLKVTRLKEPRGLTFKSGVIIPGGCARTANFLMAFVF